MSDESWIGQSIGQTGGFTGPNGCVGWIPGTTTGSGTTHHLTTQTYVQQGWQCPTCGGGVAPWVQRCPCTTKSEAPAREPSTESVETLPIYCRNCGSSYPAGKHHSCIQVNYGSHQPTLFEN